MYLRKKLYILHDTYPVGIWHISCKCLHIHEKEWYRIHLDDIHRIPTSLTPWASGIYSPVELQVPYEGLYGGPVDEERQDDYASREENDPVSVILLDGLRPCPAVVVRKTSKGKRVGSFRSAPPKD